ncbi:MAG TPA: sensor histidine kinase [Jiangellaceae bacterium]|jgi:anti-sigma regulatory factor (Ser/Thr protein kinase)|nr:sensor histidine kinase [Jiangellaceae bacterium]
MTTYGADTSGPSAGSMTHEAFFYANTNGFLAGAMPFLRAGLDAGGPVLAAVPAAGIDALQRALGGEADLVSYVDMTQAGRNPTGIIPMVLQAFAEEHPGRRTFMIGEPVWPERSAAGYLTAVQHEALINLAFAEQDAAILCSYGPSGVHATAVEDVGRTHPFVLQNGTRNASVQYADPTTVAATCLLPLPDPPATAETMAFGAAGLRAIRSLVGTHGTQAGLSEDRIREFQIAVNEVATNTIVHTDGPGRLRIWRDDDAVVCEIRDEGRITDPLAGRRRVAPDQTDGRGLLLASVMSDLLQIAVDESGNTIRIHKNID